MCMAITRVTSLGIFLSLLATEPVFAQSNSGLTPRGTIVRDPTGARLDELLTRYSMYGFAGTVLVSRGQEILLHKGYGSANRALALSNTTQTVFPIGSIAKQFTAAALLRLEMQGQLSTEDRIGKYIPELAAAKSSITIHHLLTHTSGLVEDAEVAGFVVSTRDNLVEAAKNSPLRFAPGEGFGYSNLGYNLLAAIVEKVAGQTFESFLEEHLFAPARMAQTGFRGAEWNDSLLARGYSGAFGSGEASEVHLPPVASWYNLGAGAILSTVEDLYKWHLVLDGDALLTEAAKKKLFTPVRNSYAYGWYVVHTARGTVSIQHSGDEHGFQSFVNRLPDDDVVVLLAINNRLGWRAVVVETINRILFGGAYVIPPPVVRVAQTRLEEYAGTYELPSGSRIEVWVENGDLFMGAAGQESVNLLASLTQDEAERYTSVNAISAMLMESIRSGDVASVRDVVETSTARDRADELLHWWGALARASGEIENLKVLGTAPNRAGRAVTFVELKRARGSDVVRLVWRDNKLTGWGSGIPMPAITRFLAESEASFVAFDIFTSRIVRVSVNRDIAGRVASLTVHSATDVVADRVARRDTNTRR